MAAFQADFEANGVAAIEALRQKSPEKYSEIAARLIAPAEPKANGFEAARSLEDIARKLLESVGCLDISDDMVAQAVVANDAFMKQLAVIGQLADEDELH